MPVIDGQVRRSRYKFLKLRELSSVDNPAQPGALATIMKAYNPNQPRDPAGTPTGGRWTSTHSGGGRGTSALPEGVEEFGFIPTMVLAQQTDDEDYMDASTRLESDALAAYSEIHDRLKAKLGFTDNEVHAILTSRHGRHMADDFVGGGPGVRGNAQGLVQQWTQPKWVKPLRETAAAYSAGEGEWPVALENARAKKGVASKETADRGMPLNRVAKYVCEADGAHSFQEVLRENKFSQDIWPCVDALSQSIRSIVGDRSLSGASREEKINSSVDEFLTAVRSIAPEVSKQLEELLQKKEGHMPKTAEQLQAEVEKLTGELTSATALATAEKARADKAEDELKTEREGHTATKALLVAATDEVIKVGDTELKKSEVGEAQFTVTKALSEERDLAKLEKRAAEEFPHVVGTASEKALVLRSVEKLDKDDPTRKALEAILTSAEKMTAAGFDSLGHRGAQDPTQKAANDAFMEKVHEIQKRDSCAEHEAMRKARTDHPDLFRAYQGQGEAPAAN